MFVTFHAVVGVMNAVNHYSFQLGLDCTTDPSEECSVHPCPLPHHFMGALGWGGVTVPSPQHWAWPRDPLWPVGCSRQDAIRGLQWAGRCGCSPALSTIRDHHVGPCSAHSMRLCPSWPCAQKENE